MDRHGQKAQSCYTVPSRIEEEVADLAGLIDGTVQVGPSAFEPNLGHPIATGQKTSSLGAVLATDVFAKAGVCHLAP